MAAQKNIVSFSGGKDSTAMVHLMLEQGVKIDEIMFFETGWDFLEMEPHIALVEKNTGIKITRIRYYRHFDELLSRWGWPHKSGGWCVDCKIKTCNKFTRGVKGTHEYIGYNTDEIHRCFRPNLQKKKWCVEFPLINWGFREIDTLNYCISLGYDWGGLYEIFNRVSCFCCPKAGSGRIDILKTDFPALYERYLNMDNIARSKQ